MAGEMAPSRAPGALPTWPPEFPRPPPMITLLSKHASTSDLLDNPLPGTPSRVSVPLPRPFLSSSLLGPSISHRGHRLPRQTPRTPLVSPFLANSTGLARVPAQLQFFYNDYSGSTRHRISLTSHYSIELLSYK
ncbi:hypothetical protein ACLB2K_041768 [Fragaria x ananassa]